MATTTLLSCPSFVLALAAAAAAMTAGAVEPGTFQTATMSCSGTLCGVVALETGLGSGEYQHTKPTVHGLWPEVSPYGDSSCLSPSDTTPPSTFASCYNTSEAQQDPQHQTVFVQHEWQEHGICSGTAGSTDFFGQVCQLSAGPLAVMATARAAGSDLNAIAAALTAAKYPVFQIFDDSQILLSACASKANGTYKWQLAEMSTFQTVCGGSKDNMFIV